MKKTEFIEGGIAKISGIMVSKNCPAWGKFRFISGAKSKDETRFFMTGIHIEQVKRKTLILATDGRRLHMATMDTLDIEPGNYAVKENTRDFMILYPMDDDIRYPDWRKVLPENAKKHTRIDFGAYGKAALTKMLFGFFKATGAVINMEYLEPLGSTLYGGTTWDIFFNDTEKAYTFVNGDLMAIIMPMEAGEAYEVDEVTAGPDFRDITPEVKLIDFKRFLKCKTQGDQGKKKRKTA